MSQKSDGKIDKGLQKQDYQLKIQQAQNVGQLLNVIGSVVSIYNTIQAGIEYRKNLSALMDTIERDQKVRHLDVDKILLLLEKHGGNMPQSIKDQAYLKILNLLSPGKITLPSPP